MEHNARSIRNISLSLFAICLVGCGALPVGIAPTNGGEEGCRPSSYEPYYDQHGRVNPKRDPALYDEERIRRCESFYKEAERQRKEALSQDFEEHIGQNQPEGEDGSTESSIVIKQDGTAFD